MSENDRQIAEQAMAGAREKMSRGELFVNGVQIKSIRVGNAPAIFVPGVADKVVRYLRGW